MGDWAGILQARIDEEIDHRGDGENGESSDQTLADQNERTADKQEREFPKEIADEN